MKLKTVSKWLVVLGAFEVGLMAVIRFDLIGSILGSWPTVVKIVYILILASALWGTFAMIMKKK